MTTHSFAKHPAVMEAITDIMAAALEVNKEDGLQVWVEYSGHVDWLDVKAAAGHFTNHVEMRRAKQINLGMHYFGNDIGELAEQKDAFLAELLEHLADVKAQILTLGATYGGLTKDQIDKMSQAEAHAKQLAQEDEVIASLEKKLTEMKANRKNKAA